MKAAILVIDMVRDNLPKHGNLAISKQGRAIIPKLNEFLDKSRERNILIVFASDSFLKEDFIFRGKMKPHAIRGTSGAEIVDEIKKETDDILLAKRRFSAFYKTDLDQTLRTKGIHTVAITGIATSFCVLSTAFDALSNDFNTIIVEDCCAAHDKGVHQTIVEIYRNTPLYPLFQILNAYEFFKYFDRERNA